MRYTTTQALSDKQLTLIAYALHLLGAATIVTSIVALIINYLKRTQVPRPFDSHHRWMIRTFWWSVVWGVIGGILKYVGIGYLMLLGVLIWWIYRMVRGILALADNRPVPA